MLQLEIHRAIAETYRRGFADTDLQSLEKATGVNKSGLYFEFESKEDLFLASLTTFVGAPRLAQYRRPSPCRAQQS